MSLKINGLKANIAGNNQKILKGIDLEVNPGEIHIIMGKNGSGKSSLSKVLLDHYDYELTAGQIELDGEDITEFDTTDRALAGLFLASQYPVEVPGVNLTQFLRLAVNSNLAEDDKLSLFAFRKQMKVALKKVGLSEEFMKRNLNEGFSGGEKKKTEILQLLLLKPKYAVLDETDSGLDLDALKVIFSGLADITKDQSDLGMVIITHYLKVLDYLKPDYVHLLENGKIINSGGIELARKIEEKGYDNVEL